MPKISKEDANDTLMRAVTALEAVKFDTIKVADDERIEKFVAMLRECHERFDPYMDSWIADYYQRRKQEEMEG
jgi:hypothetical protein